MSRFYVGGKVVDSVDFLRKRHWAWRLDLWPFAIMYGAWLAAIVPSLDAVDAFIVLGCLVALHILVFLFTVWSVDFKCFVQYSKANDIHQADTCKVTPAKFSGSKEIVPLHFQKLAGSSNSVDAEEIYFDFRKQRFVYSKETNTFCKLCYPTKETMGYYLKTSGYGTEVVAATKKWGRNLIEYPSPTLTKLMKKQCMQPTFVFQVFSALSWSINGYWYYSLFALFMLFMFESIVAKACLMIKSALAYTRGVSQSRILMVYLCGKWKKLSGT